MSISKFFDEFKEFNIDKIEYCPCNLISKLKYDNSINVYAYHMYPDVQVRSDAIMIKYDNEITLNIYRSGYVILIHRIIPNEIIHFKIQDMCTEEIFNMYLVKDLHGMNMDFVHKCKEINEYIELNYYNTDKF